LRHRSFGVEDETRRRWDKSRTHGTNLIFAFDIEEVEVERRRIAGVSPPVCVVMMMEHMAMRCYCHGYGYGDV